jgi:autotransporter-associated beta strand protein
MLNNDVALTVNGTASFNNPSQAVGSLTGNGTLTLNSTALNLSADTSFAGAITGSGTVNVAAGTVTLSGANSFRGGVVSGGSLVLSTAGPAPPLSRPPGRSAPRPCFLRAAL